VHLSADRTRAFARVGQQPKVGRHQRHELTRLAAVGTQSDKQDWTTSSFVLSFQNGRHGTSGRTLVSTIYDRKRPPVYVRDAPRTKVSATP
jgi:hypothetical protein